MHTPYCPQIVTSLDTIVLPFPGNQRVVAAGGRVDAKTPLRKSTGLTVSCRDFALIELEQEGENVETRVSFWVPPGTHRYMLADNCERVLVTSQYAVLLWTEDLAAATPTGRGA